MTVTADGGWFTAILLISLLFVGILAYRKRWPSKKPLLAGGRGSSDDSKQKPSNEPEKKESHRHGPKQKIPLGTLIKWAIFALIIVLIVVNIVPIVGWIVDTFMHDFFGDRIVHPRQVVVTQRRTTVVTVPPRIPESHPIPTVEPPSYSVFLVDGSLPDWIKVPKDYQLVYWLDGAPKGQEIGMQCSYDSEEPTQDAWPGYPCDPSKPQAEWIRPYIYNHELLSVTFRYRFRHV